MHSDNNPFLVSGYINESLFCDRQKETELLIKNMKGKINTTLFAIRRLGKTGLIKHAFHKIEKDKKHICIYTDIFATKDLRDLTNTLATAIYNRFPENKGIGKQITEFIKRLRPTITYDQLTGNPEVSIDVSKNSGYEKTIRQLFDFLNHQKVKVVFAIDEFQQITQYPEKNTEAFLRSHIQHLKNTAFIFSGSNYKLMHEMFNNAKRPFYASCSNLTLHPINEKEYTAFILKQFLRHKKNITAEAVQFILEWTCRHTFYTQFLCNRVFESGIKKVTEKDVITICAKIHEEEEGVYFQYRNLLTQAQWSLLKAISKEEKVEKLNAKEFIYKYQLGAVSSVNRSIEALQEKDLIHRLTTVPNAHYSVNDKFLMRWLQRR